MILISAIVATIAGQAAWAGDEMLRALRVDWEPIEGAVKYELHRFSDAGCKESVDKVEVKTNFWESRLDAGQYCVRIRGVSSDGVKGQWSEAQKIEVRPKPPKELVRDGTELKWDETPKASKYMVSVKDPQGKVVWSQEVKKPKVEIPASLAEKAGEAATQWTVGVQAVVPGVSPSVATEGTAFDPSQIPSLQLSDGSAVTYQVPKAATPEAGNYFVPTKQAPLARQIGGSNQEAASAAVERLKIYAPSFPKAPKVAMALPPEEAVKRYQSLGEKPVPPSQEEWKQAQTPDEKESLKRRTVASQRIELLDRIDRSKAPDLTFTGQIQSGGMDFDSDVPGRTNANSSDSRMGYSLGVDYNRNRPWGAYARWSRIPLAVDGISTAAQWFSVGGEYHLMLDSIGESLLTLGVGLGYARFPLILDFSTTGGSQARFSYPIALWGLDAKIEYEFRFTTKFSALAGLHMFFAHTQGNLSDVLPTANGTVTQFQIAGQYALNKQVDLGLGFMSNGASAQTTSFGLSSRYQQSSVQAYASFRLNPRELRGPASIDESGRFKLLFSLPVGGRTSVIRSNPTGANDLGVSDPRTLQPYNTSNFVAGFDLGLQYLPSPESPLWVDGTFQMQNVTTSSAAVVETDVRVKAGLDSPFLGSRSTRLRYGGGVFTRSVGDRNQDIQTGIRSTGLLGTAELSRIWPKGWDSKLAMQFGMPLLMSATSGPMSQDSATTSDGANFFWSASFGGSYQISRSWSLLGIVTYEQLRMGLVGSRVNVERSQAIDFEETRFRLGLQFRW
ncbi:MAG: hypothetical protein JNL01_04110 [Bdellovibrionales bacterium]|nr:hypothetical protein [Bdellovibrionales bacterium]